MDSVRVPKFNFEKSFQRCLKMPENTEFRGTKVSTFLIADFKGSRKKSYTDFRRAKRKGRGTKKGSDHDEDRRAT